jgi:cellulose synthase/poly-beta-1,6-N-acetylglucosamine synthase-like glycosyltransferase
MDRKSACDDDRGAAGGSHDPRRDRAVGSSGYLALHVLYQLLLIAANAWVPDPVAFEPRAFRRFNVIIPAHDEELYLPGYWQLQAQAYPKDRYRVTVVADNCKDRTVDACLTLMSTF